jgi:hypothetical protein
VSARDVATASGKADTIRAIYAAVDAPDWAAPNLDALIDVLRDLSWLPPGPVVLRFAEPDRVPPEVRAALAIAETDSADTDHPVTMHRVR